MKRFDAIHRREMANWMRRAIERTMAAGLGRPLPPKYEFHYDEFDEEVRRL